MHHQKLNWWACVQNIVSMPSLSAGVGDLFQPSLLITLLTLSELTTSLIITSGSVISVMINLKRCSDSRLKQKSAKTPH